VYGTDLGNKTDESHSSVNLGTELNEGNRSKKVMQDNQIENNLKNRAVCVDFDGVLANISGDIEHFGSPISGGAEALCELRAHGLKIIIHTSRPARQEHLKQLESYLVEAGIPFDEINSNSDCIWPSKKPLADLYIDDRALRFEGDWKDTIALAKHYLGLNHSNGGQLAYEDLLSRVIERAEEVAKFESFLREKTTWLTAPASTRFHLARERGLIDHSLNAALSILKLRQALAPDNSEESCIIVALYHDVGKVGLPGKPYYVPCPPRGQDRKAGTRYMVNPELAHLDLPSRSLYLISKFVPLNEDEMQAIRYHDGQYISENQSVAHRETELTRLLQYADNWSGGVIEKNLHAKSAD
jgi:hypothetical protein